MGTLLFSRGVPQRASLDELVLSRPELVTAVHREYIAAGAEVIETDTFSANRVHLGLLGLADRTAAINRRAAQLAREAREVSGRDVLVAGSIGPVSSPLHGPSHLSDRVAGSSASEQLEGLLEGGIDLVMIETASDVGHLLAAVDAARRACDLPMASLSFDEDLLVADGQTAAEAARPPAAAGVDALGVDLPIGPHRRHRRARADGGGRPAGTPLLVCPMPACPVASAASSCGPPRPPTLAEECARFLAAGHGWWAAAAAQPRARGGHATGTGPRDGTARRPDDDRCRGRRARESTGDTTWVDRRRGRLSAPGPRGIRVGRRVLQRRVNRAPRPHGPGDRTRGGPLRRQRGDRPTSASVNIERDAAVGRVAHPRGRRGPRATSRQCHGARAHGAPWPWASPSSVTWASKNAHRLPRPVTAT